MKKVFMFVNVDWFFLSHREPIALASKENDVHMSVYTDVTNSQNKNLNKSYDLIQSPIRRSSKSIFHVFEEFLRCYFLVKKAKPDLLHAVTIKPILIVGLVSRLTSTPFIGAISGLGPAFKANNFFKNFRLKIIIKFLKFIFGNNKAVVICQTENDSDVFIKNEIIKQNQIFFITGSGVDIEKFSPTKKRLDVDRYVLMSSRMLSDKGVNEFCLAAKIVKQKLGDEVKFKLSGPIDNFSPTFISQTSLEKITNSCGVDYLGDIENMPELLASSLIFVLPSYYPEGIPKVLLEAAASGVPVITTDHPGCKDAIIKGQTGLLVPAGDSITLANSIIELLENDSLLIEMGRKGRILAESNFKDSEVVRRHYEIYKNMYD